MAADQGWQAAFCLHEPNAVERLRPLSPSAEVELHSVLLLVCIPTIWQLSGLAIVDAHTQRQSCVHQFEAVLSHTNPKKQEQSTQRGKSSSR